MKARTIETRRGVRCRVFEAGSGPPLVFFHGAGGLLRENPFLEDLARRHHVLAPEWPAYGESTGEELLEDMLDFALHGWDVVEALDRTGLWGRLLPEWGAVRDLPPRDRAHVWTVDRHLVEATAQAARLTTRVARPDLLLVGTLLHDIGKGRGGDHSVVGESLAVQVGRRLGFAEPDVVVLGAMVSILVLTLVALLMAGPLMRLMGAKIEAVITRLLGVLLAALAVQFVIDGVTASLR